MLRLAGQQHSCITKESTQCGPGSAKFEADCGPQWDRGQGGNRGPQGSQDHPSINTISQRCYLLVHVRVEDGGSGNAFGAQSKRREWRRTEELPKPLSLFPSLILSNQQLLGTRSGHDLSYLEEGMGSGAENKTELALQTMSDWG